MLIDGAKQVIKDRGDQMSLYGLMKAFKIDKVRFYFKELRKNDLYPFTLDEKTRISNEES